VAGAAGAADSAAARRRVGFPGAGGLPDDRPAEAEAQALRIAEVPASNAGRRSVHPVERARPGGRRAALSPEVAHRCSQGRVLPLAAAQAPEWRQGPRSVQEERGLESAPGSCRRLVLVEARDREPAWPSDRPWGPASGLDSDPASELDSGQPRCPVWGAEIGPRTCRRRAEIAPPACKIAWPAAIA
jgi:hypothetical protein